MFYARKIPAWTVVYYEAILCVWLIWPAMNVPESMTRQSTWQQNVLSVVCSAASSRLAILQCSAESQLNWLWVYLHGVVHSVNIPAAAERLQPRTCHALPTYTHTHKHILVTASFSCLPQSAFLQPRSSNFYTKCISNYRSFRHRNSWNILQKRSTSILLNKNEKSNVYGM